MITGTSGAGKGTLVQELLRRVPEVALAVSATTRGRRPGEVDGVHYWFISDEEFDRRLAEDDFLEYYAFPWGQRLTVVRGTVSQLDSTRGEVVGPPHMVDASVSYGSSGGGVFDAQTGERRGLVQSYRPARFALPAMRERVVSASTRPRGRGS